MKRIILTGVLYLRQQYFKPKIYNLPYKRRLFKWVTNLQKIRNSATFQNRQNLRFQRETYFYSFKKV